MIYTIKKYSELKDSSEVRAEIEVSAEHFAPYRTKAIQALSKTLKADGFRKGKVPESVLVKHVGESGILEEAANLAIGDIYPQVLKEKELLILDTPMITITNLVANETFTFTMQAAIPPVFILPEYTKLAQKHLQKGTEPEVSDDEVQKALVSIRRQHKYISLMQDNVAPESAATEADKTPEADLPELDESTFTQLGVKDLDELTAEVRANIAKEKTAQEKNKARTALLDALVADTKIPLPPVLISHEIDRLQAQFEGDLQRVGSNLNAYLKSVGKTAEQFHEELKPQAEKQAKLQLILNKIAETAELTPNNDEVKHETEHVLKHHPEADERAAAAYVTMTLRNQMVMAHLEQLAA